MAIAGTPDPLWKQIYLRARDIERVRDPETLLAQKTILSELVSKYLSISNLKDLKCDFYARTLKTGLTYLQKKDLEVGAIRLIAHKVKIATHYLAMAQASQSWSLLPRPLNVSLASALANGQQHLLRQFSHQLNTIDPKQIEALYNWALENWDLHIIYEILKKCPVSTDRLDPLVVSALEKGQFESIAFPLILNHLESLSAEIRSRVEKWMIDYDPKTENLGQESFQKEVERRLENAKEPGSFQDLKIRNFFLALPLELLKRVVDWAEENDDEILLQYLVRENILPKPILDETVTRSILVPLEWHPKGPI